MAPAAADADADGDPDVQEEALSPREDENTGDDAGNGAGEGDDEVAEEETAEAALARADELFEKGSMAINSGEFFDAVDCLSQALEIRVGHYGELARECASAYYKYGCALLCKAQEEADPLGNVPAAKLSSSGKLVPSSGADESECSKASSSKTEDPQPGADKDDGASVNVDQNNDDDGNDSDQEDEEESDLDLAWKMLDISRAIIEKSEEETMEKVNVYSALAEVAMEREDLESSHSDYIKALSILERLVEPDHRRVVELNFRICLVLEISSKIDEAIPYCAKAITLCKSRINKLKNANEGFGSGKKVQEGPENTDVGSDIEFLSDILSELEKKLEDLEEAKKSPAPSSLFADVLKMMGAAPPAEKSQSNCLIRTGSLSSSQMGSFTNGLDSPTVSTATADSKSVTNLGVVGRGIKRAVARPCVPEPPHKKQTTDTSVEKDEGTSSQLEAPKEAVDGNSFSEQSI